jgi:transcriptional regulator with XRE-family HTH domain
MPEHGTRKAYRSGCGCVVCRAANAADKARRMSQCNTVYATEAKAHLKTLEKSGIGYRQAAALAGLTPRAILNIRSGETTTIRRETETRILKIPPRPALGARVRLGRASRQLSALRAEGFTLADLGRRLGLASAFALHRSGYIRVRTALRVQALYRAHVHEPDTAES